MEASSLVSSPLVGGKLTLSVPLPPAFIGHALDGARQALSELLMKYHAGFHGVLLAFARAHFAADGRYQADGGAPLGRIVDELPVVHMRVACDALVFRPELGQILSGRVNSVGEGHIGLLVAGLFNASVLREDMAHGYSFVEDAAGAEAAADSGGETGLALAQGAWAATDVHARACADAADASAAPPRHSSDGSRKRRRTASHEDSAATASARRAPNRILACNPAAIQLGSDVCFRVVGVAHSQGVLSLHGSFVDDGSATAPDAAQRQPQPSDAAFEPDHGVPEKSARKGSAASAKRADRADREQEEDAQASDEPESSRRHKHEHKHKHKHKKQRVEEA